MNFPQKNLNSTFTKQIENSLDLKASLDIVKKTEKKDIAQNLD